MTLADTFVAVMLVLQVCATMFYAAQKDWNLALYWAGATVITGAILWRATQ